MDLVRAWIGSERLGFQRNTSACISICWTSCVTVELIQPLLLTRSHGQATQQQNKRYVVYQLFVHGLDSFYLFAAARLSIKDVLFVVALYLRGCNVRGLI